MEELQEWIVDRLCDAGSGGSCCYVVGQDKARLAFWLRFHDHALASCSLTLKVENLDYSWRN